LQKARVEWGKKWKEKRLRLRTPNWSGPSEISHRAWFSPEEYKQLYTATRQRVREPEKKDFNCEAENLHDFVLFAVNTGLRPDEAWRDFKSRDVTIVYHHHYVFEASGLPVHAIIGAISKHLPHSAH
jgi:hypothetical protein